ncbi:hypothetical protein [Asticcacaulis sp. AND118]|uniref:hypothetical protein n=1 Tax=Asticcacaulis sp. AND118 TaxID=2840468 RepID=UPI001CFFEE99|nr:hypothetical protein [Asticcacaulis sp. AND118]UDF05329.1 hypothetical protein LH365_14045 [Asticcacaulis sp. AND118]
MTARIDPAEFEGQRVLITAGTKGAGRATVQRFLAGCARVITAARSSRMNCRALNLFWPI